MSDKLQFVAFAGWRHIISDKLKFVGHRVSDKSIYAEVVTVSCHTDPARPPGRQDLSTTTLPALNDFLVWMPEHRRLTHRNNSEPRAGGFNERRS
jgi:hypothetical protein